MIIKFKIPNGEMAIEGATFFREAGIRQIRQFLKEWRRSRPRPEEVQELIRWLRQEEDRVQTRLSVSRIDYCTGLNQLSDLEENYTRMKNPCYAVYMLDTKKLKETKVERRIGPTLKPEQREEVRCACENELELALCDLLYTSGIRISELCQLDKKDIDFTNMKAIVYGKGRKEREVYFNGQAKVHLARYLETRKDDNPALFVSSRKPYRRISDQTIRNMLKKIKERDKDLEAVVLTPHVFRRTIGTDMINKGAPLELVAEKLGHVQLDTTKQCYAAIARATVQQAHNRYVG